MANPTRKTRKSSRPVPKSTGGADTAARVLEAARTILIEDGYAELSARRVAAKAGISVGNLTYHFPDKTSLLRALVGALVEAYGAEIERQLTDVAQPGPDRLGALIAWLVRDAASTNTMRLFRELWVMALHDKNAARAVDDFYDAAMARAKALLKDLSPDIPDAEVGRLVLLCAMISEGSTVLFGTRRNREYSARDMAGFAAGIVKGLATRSR